MRKRCCNEKRLQREELQALYALAENWEEECFQPLDAGNWEEECLPRIRGNLI
jgi:hypothetical protein